MTPILEEATYGGPPQGWWTRWMCVPPALGVEFQVIRQEWDDDPITASVRTIYEVRV